jgi:hypothetical protein
MPVCPERPGSSILQEYCTMGCDDMWAGRC